jgi:hypothetical protein
MSHAIKFVTGLVGRRIEGRTGGNPLENYFGFRENRGPQDAILCFRMLIEKMIQMCKPLYIAFLELENALKNEE